MMSSTACKIHAHESDGARDRMAVSDLIRVMSERSYRPWWSDVREMTSVVVLDQAHGLFVQSREILRPLTVHLDNTASCCC
jgi:hypothetical protein